MSRKRKEDRPPTRQVGIQMDLAVWVRLEAYLKRTGRTLKATVQRAILRELKLAKVAGKRKVRTDGGGPKTTQTWKGKWGNTNV